MTLTRAAQRRRLGMPDVEAELAEYRRQSIDRRNAGRADNPRTVPVPPYRDMREEAGQMVRPCRLCDLAILNPDGSPNRRRLWHEGCAEAYMALSSAQGLRAFCWKRDGGACANCGQLEMRHGEWYADHIAPLWAGGIHSLDNVQTLCRPCHEAKTAYEATMRARLRRRANVEAKYAAAGVEVPSLPDIAPALSALP